MGFLNHPTLSESSRFSLTLEVSRFPLRLTLADLQRCKDSADVARLRISYPGEVGKIIDSKVPLKGGYSQAGTCSKAMAQQVWLIDTTDGINNVDEFSILSLDVFFF